MMLRPTLQARAGYNLGWGPGISAPFGYSSAYNGKHNGQDYFWLSATSSASLGISIPDSLKVFPVVNGPIHVLEAPGLGKGLWQQIDAQHRAYWWHLASWLVADGTTVGTNTPVGIMGHTGSAAGSQTHLHFEVRKYPYNDANRIDPEPFFASTSPAGGGTTPIQEIPMSMFDDFVLNPAGGGYWFSPNFGAVPVTAIEAQAIAAIKAFQTNGTRVPDNMLATASNLVRRAATGWMIPQIADAIDVAQGGFTATDRATLDGIASSGELAQALTSTVALINDRADANKAEILDAIEDIPGGGASGGNYALSLNIDGVPGTASGTATPA